MYKKIYCLLASLLLLGACTAEDTWDEKGLETVNNNEMQLTFTVDQPTATVISSKSGSAADAELEGITDLRLFAFDADGKFQAEVEPKLKSEGDQTTYSAIVSKEIGSLHFLAGYGTGTLNLTKGTSTAADLVNIETEDYVFWGSTDFTDLKDAGGNPIVYDPTKTSLNIGVIDLFRNWAKFSVYYADGLKLKDIEFMLYNQATNSKIGTMTHGTVNPVSASEASNFGNTGSFVQASAVGSEVTNDVHPFENSKNNSTYPTFVIIKGNYDNKGVGYYKLDLSSMDDESKLTITHDVLRNHWYKIRIKNVAMKGVSWEEVINPNKLPDNNVTAAVELDEYPKIAYNNESLEVEKTTFIFTEYTYQDGLDTWAIYKEGTTAKPDKLEVISEDVANVMDSEVEWSTSDGRIWNNSLKAIDPDNIKEGYFYVKGGNLQRKVKVILRKAYDFTFTADPNPVGGASGQTVNLKFTMPDDVDPSIFPLECKIRTTKLYAVEEGMRIQSNGDKTYDYIYTAQEYNPDGYTLAFKTNSSDSDETISLSADYFNTITTDLTTTDQSVTIAAKFTRRRFSVSDINEGTITLTYTSSKKGNGSRTFTTNNSARANDATKNITLPADAENIRLSYERNDRTYTANTTIADLKDSSKTIQLNN